MNTLEEPMAATIPAVPAGHARFSGALRSEWTKLRTVRTTRWLLIALVVATLALGAGLSASEATSVAHESAARKATFDPANWSLAVLGFTQAFFGILGALAISGEYSTGTIRSTLAAVPRRPRLLAAKLTVLGLAALVAGELVTFAMFFTGQALLRSAGAPYTTLGQPGVARAVTATGVFLALLALFGAGCGVIFRGSALSIAAYIVGAFLSFFILGFSHLGKYTPELMLLNSVSAVRSNAAGGFLPPGWESVALLASYTAVLLSAAAILFARRDA
jgi:ABC-type transport system involved in multi-copper enzyme maturation permease subunit